MAEVAAGDAIASEEVAAADKVPAWAADSRDAAIQAANTLRNTMSIPAPHFV
ncbi:MAG: hypothetical protein VB138_02630 [Burkholderia sp.]